MTNFKNNCHFIEFNDFKSIQSIFLVRLNLLLKILFLRSSKFFIIDDPQVHLK